MSAAGLSILGTVVLRPPCASGCVDGCRPCLASQTRYDVVVEATEGSPSPRLWLLSEHDEVRICGAGLARYVPRLVAGYRDMLQALVKAVPADDAPLVAVSGS